MDYDNDNVPMTCPNCNTLEEGIPKMISHVIEFHKAEYTTEEALDYVTRWAEKAYMDIEEAQYRTHQDYKNGRLAKDPINGGWL